MFEKQLYIANEDFRECMLIALAGDDFLTRLKLTIILYGWSGDATEYMFLLDALCDLRGIPRQSDDIHIPYSEEPGCTEYLDEIRKQIEEMIVNDKQSQAEGIVFTELATDDGHLRIRGQWGDLAYDIHLPKQAADATEKERETMRDRLAFMLKERGRILERGGVLNGKPNMRLVDGVPREVEA